MNRPTAEDIRDGRLQIWSIIGILVLFSLSTSVAILIAGQNLSAMHFIRPLALIGFGKALSHGYGVVKAILAFFLALGALNNLLAIPSLRAEHGAEGTVTLLVVSAVLVGMVIILLASPKIDAVIAARKSSVEPSR